MQRNRVQVEDAIVFRNDFSGRYVYSLGVSGKKYEDGRETGGYINSYLNLQFKRGNEPENRQHIDITDAFLTSYEGNDGKGKLKLYVSEWQPHNDDVPY